jgi:hypothetical protein
MKICVGDYIGAAVVRFCFVQIVATVAVRISLYGFLCMVIKYWCIYRVPLC